MHRIIGLIATTALAVSACSVAGSQQETTVTFPGGVTTQAPRPMPPVDPDAPVERVIELREGDLDATEVESKLAAEVAGYVAGSGRHAASFDGGDGRVDLFTFTTDEVLDRAENGEIVVCRTAVLRGRAISGFGCTSESPEPPPNGVQALSTESGAGTTQLTAAVGPRVSAVILEFDTGARWRLIPANGIVYAEWPWGRGTAVRVVAIGEDGSAESIDI